MRPASAGSSAKQGPLPEAAPPALVTPQKSHGGDQAVKIIHLTDTHLVGFGTVHGADPAARLAGAVASINAEHGDAAHVIVTGDLTENGEAAAYARFAEEIAKLTMPVHLMLGNHDNPDAFRQIFPTAPCDDTGFTQSAIDTPQGRLLLLDTHLPGSHAGRYCEARRDWLARQLARPGPVMVFMHHPPFDIGIPSLDAIKLQEAEAFHAVLAPHKSRIRHLFFGHVHRALWGTWRGIPYSAMRGLNHQVGLNLTGPADRMLGNFEPPAYGVALITDDQVTVHLHDYADPSPDILL
ncbi:phosphodiesterase [Pacificoceanicola onchidii]|uniref:phosphodiesterase n=1 Tax=Pacificoceanicola onchidii TaxID=2562685 RepID=UPI001F0FB225|nr:phosphodiesterase [Pacificoceanicola onchidii]